MKKDSPTNAALFRVMLGLALPVLAEELLNLCVGFTDRFLAGWFLPGPEPQAAMGLAAYVLWLIPTMFSAIGIGATALVAREIGGERFADARRTLGQALYAGTILAIFVTAAVYLGGPTFVRWMNLEGESGRLAEVFLAWLAPVVPIIMLEQIGTACLRGAGDTVTGLVARIAVNVVNIVVSILLVSGVGPFPQLGFQGLAIGAACGHGTGGLVILAALLRGRKHLRLESAAWRFDGPLLARLLRVGLPGGIDLFSLVTCHLFYLRIITGLGDLATAAHGIGLQIEALSYLSGCAFQVAAATMAGQALGAGDADRARRSVLLAVGAALVPMLSAALLFYFAGESVAALFTGTHVDETSRIAGRLLKIVALGGPPMAVLIVLSGALRGAGDTRWNLVITFIGLIGVRLPLAAILAWSSFTLFGQTFPSAGWGVAGAWTAMVADVTVRALLTAGRFFHGGWIHVKV